MVIVKADLPSPKFGTEERVSWWYRELGSQVFDEQMQRMMEPIVVDN